MIRLTVDHLRAIAGPKAKPKIIAGVVAHLDLLDRFGISKPHRLAHFIAQIAHESDRFATTTEYASGEAYEGRKDLGNTQRGDGKRFRGRGLIQTTGRYNTTEFTVWVRNHFPDLDPPDFVKHPEKLAEFPWAMISAVMYWETRKLSAYADANNIEMITKRINGGLNGYADRIDLYARSALVLLGYKMNAGVVKRFQADAGLVADDIPGPATRGALHTRLTVAKTFPTEIIEADKPPDIPAPEWHPADPVWPPPDYEREPPKEPEMAQKTGIGSIVGLIIIVGLVALFIYAKFIAGWI